MTRRGCAPGDLLFASGPLGLGGAFALARLLGGSEADGERIPFRPVARLTEGQLLRPFASGCMDSDGALPTLDELMRLNGVGFRFRITAAESLHPAAAAAASRARIPPWMLLAGPHGEYELLFTVPRGRLERFLAAARAREWRPLHLGEAVREPGLTLPIDGTLRQLDTTAVRNLFGEVGGDFGAYREGLARLAAAATTERARCAR
jgi:thiamine-monophosphate kinase